jgi:tRNA pseudouridine55 synthase
MGAADHWHGLIPVDKPSGMTSHDVVSAVRQILNQRGVGHTGTLDPRATGLLILCVGRATKVAQFISSCDKSYVADICLGRATATYDAEGLDQSLPLAQPPDMTSDELEELLSEYVGTFRQQVPAFSAVKVQGRPLYESARRGEEVDAPEREVEISSLRLLSYQPPNMHIELTCSKGTYVRSLAHDIGRKLGCGGYLAELRRTSIARFSVDQALTLTELEKCARSGRLETAVLPVEQVLNHPALKVTEAFSRKVVNGRSLRTSDLLSVEGEFNAGDCVVLKNPAGQILAIGTAGVDATVVTSANGKTIFNYLRVLN